MTDRTEFDTWTAGLWRLIDAYRRGEGWPVSCRDRIKAHLEKCPAAPSLTVGERFQTGYEAAINDVHSARQADYPLVLRWTALAHQAGPKARIWVQFAEDSTEVEFAPAQPAAQAEPVAELPWQRLAIAWLKGQAAKQAQTNQQYPDHAKCYPRWTAYVETAERLAEELESEFQFAAASNPPRAGDGKNLAVPFGMALVPTTPTKEMNRAGFHAHQSTGLTGEIWRAMLAAAPTLAPLTLETAEEARKDRAHAEAYYRQAEKLLTANEQTLRAEIERLQSQNRTVAETIVSNDKAGAVKWAQGLLASLDDVQVSVAALAAAPAAAPAQFADGDSPCVLEWGAVSLPIGDPSRVTNLTLCRTLWDAIAEGALCGFDWRVYPLADVANPASIQAPATVSGSQP